LEGHKFSSDKFSLAMRILKLLDPSTWELNVSKQLHYVMLVIQSVLIETLGKYSGQVARS